MDLRKRRRTNLKKLIAERFDSNNAEFCRATDKNPNSINLILTKNQSHQRAMGEVMARELEIKLNLPVNYFDRSLDDDHVTNGVELFIWGTDASSKLALGKMELPSDVFYSYGFSNPKDCFIQIKNECKRLKNYGLNSADLMIVDKSDQQIVPIPRVFVCVFENFIVTLPLKKIKQTITLVWDNEDQETSKDSMQDNPLDRSYPEKKFHSLFKIHGRVVGKLPMMKIN